jgi:hypothetical protein
MLALHQVRRGQSFVGPNVDFRGAGFVIGCVSSPINLAKISRGSSRFHLPATDRETLDRWVRARGTPQGLLRRSHIILSLGDGLSGRAVAAKLNVTRHTVDLWRVRYLDGGCVALTREKPGRGRKPQSAKASSTEDSLAQLF